MILSIGLSTKKTIFSWLIRLYQGTKYSHAYIRIETNGHNLVLDATIKGVTIRNYEDFDKKNKIIKEKRLDSKYLNIEQLSSIVVPFLGKSYGYLTILGILFKNIGIKGIGQDGNKTFICSELVARVLERYIGLDHGKFDYMTPKHIEILMERL